MKPNPVGWFEIYVSDLERSRAFYEAVLGVKLDPLPNAPVEILAFPMASQVYGAPGALVRMDGCEGGPGGTLVYFSCEDCAVEAGRVGTNGGRVLKEKFAIGEYGFIAIVQDPDENSIGLHSMR